MLGVVDGDGHSENGLRPVDTGAGVGGEPAVFAEDFSIGVEAGFTVTVITPVGELNNVVSDVEVAAR